MCLEMLAQKTMSIYEQFTTVNTIFIYERFYFVNALTSSSPKFVVIDNL